MSFHAPLQPKSDAPLEQPLTRRVICDLPEHLAVTSAELDLLELWLAEAIADVLGSGEVAVERQ